MSPLVAFSVVAFVVKYPITMTLTLANIDRAMVFGMDEYWINSLLIAIAVSVLGAAVSWLAAYVSARTTSLVERSTSSASPRWPSPSSSWASPT